MTQFIVSKISIINQRTGENISSDVTKQILIQSFIKMLECVSQLAIP